MNSWFRTCSLMGLATLGCVAGLTACGGASPTASRQGAPTTSPPPGPGDAAVCQLVTQATAAYKAQNYSTWRSDMKQIGNTAATTQYFPLKRYADEVQRVTTGTTTTTKPKSKKNSKGVTFSGSLSVLGGYVGLQRVCANLPSGG